MLVAAPVGSRHGHELEGAQLARIVHVRAAAQIREGAVMVDAELFAALRELVDEVELVRLVLEHGTGLIFRDDAVLERAGRGHALTHEALDRAQIIGRERARQGEVVVEAVLDGRADAELPLGKQLEHGLGHHVRRAVAHRVQVAAFIALVVHPELSYLA